VQLITSPTFERFKFRGLKYTPRKKVKINYPQKTVLCKVQQITIHNLFT
jgi:hypothetical protein